MNRWPFSRALVELANIVFSILIALFAESTWNNYRGRVEGQTYLSRLAVEARANLELLTEDKA